MHFQSGQISKHIAKWHEITSDPEVLDSVRGLHIEFSTEPHQTYTPKTYQTTHLAEVDNEIAKLLRKGIIEKSQHEPGEYISPIFLKEKKDGSYRMILNLKRLNAHVQYHHFKMESIQSAIRLLTPNCFMASIDLKDAYYCVPIASFHHKYLKFEWNGSLYQFTCFPNGLACCPRKFTKLMKPVFCYLRKLGHQSSPYIDDSLLTGQTYDDCAANVIDTTQLIDNLGFIAHPDKSVFIPTQELDYLGFTLNSKTMRVTVTPGKKLKLIETCKELLTKEYPTIREVARVIGLLISNFPGVAMGPLYYRLSEADKIAALKHNKGKFDATMQLSAEAKEELVWWIDNIDTAFNPVHRGKPNITIQTDASKLGWGCALGDKTTGGLWAQTESYEHINYLKH
ncbi:Hypothetical predicted protein [Paramuricea clavata]|uniref:Uncharacterized protein n=1 Tax=Paramuricea clavata TaxID=317549 RepID=A0A6S7IDJ0_PARCT|nr:Hypothetical predicted protein [Paramuricea clavata]